MSIRIFSYGGCGYHFLVSFLEKYVVVRNSKHNPHRRPIPGLCNIHIIIYGDPRNAVLSFFRRQEWKRSQNGKNKNWINMFFINHSIKRKMVPLNFNLETFLMNYSEDIFELYDYFKAWFDFNPGPGNSLIFVRYEKLPQIINELLKFLKLDSNYAIVLRKTFKHRISDYLSKDLQIQKLLTQRYEKLIKLQDSLPPFFVKQ